MSWQAGIYLGFLFEKLLFRELYTKNVKEDKTLIMSKLLSESKTEQTITVNICFNEPSNPQQSNEQQAIEDLEVLKNILENTAVQIVLERYQQQVEEKKKL